MDFELTLLECAGWSHYSASAILGRTSLDVEDDRKERAGSLITLLSYIISKTSHAILGYVIVQSTDSPLFHSLLSGFSIICI